MSGLRTERDLLGAREIPAKALHGVHTARAVENFPLSGRPVPPGLARAYGSVKLACATTNRELGVWAGDAAKADAIERACQELADGLLVPHIIVDLLQGGAGTSTNMNVNEVLANRALEILGLPPGSYERVSPLDDLNRHQSTNDTYPTALKLAAIALLRELEQNVLALQESFQAAEKKFAHVVKVGRTGADFMDLAKPGLIKEHCCPNALSSCTEYLMGYASPETRRAGEALVDRELETLPGSVGKTAKELVRRVRQNERDVFV